MELLRLLFGGRYGRAVGGNDTFEVGAVFDHDLRGGEVSSDGGVLLDFNSVERTKAALDGTVNHYFAGNRLGVYVGPFSDGNAMARNGKRSLRRAVPRLG